MKIDQKKILDRLNYENSLKIICECCAGETSCAMLDKTGGTYI